MDKTQTIALFGGSFDPPHIGHENIVKALLNLDYIDKIIIMPTFLNPFKSKSHAPATLRLSWLKKIFNQFKNVEVSDYETNQNKKVPSIQTVDYISQKYDKIYLVIGADNLESLDTWYKYEKLKSKVSFIVVTRDRISISDSFIKLNIDESISSTKLRKNIDRLKLPLQCADEIYKYYKRISK